MPNMFEAEELASGAAGMLEGSRAAALAEQVGSWLAAPYNYLARTSAKIPVSLSSTEELRAIPKVDLLAATGGQSTVLPELEYGLPRGLVHALKFTKGTDELAIYPSTNGKAEIVFDESNGVQFVHFTREMSVEQRKQQVLVASFAHLIKSDPGAIDAVSLVPAETGALIPRPTVVATTEAQMRNLAVEGAQAYVKGEAGNNFTGFLRSSLGDWTAKDTSMFMQVTDQYGVSNFDSVLGVAAQGGLKPVGSPAAGMAALSAAIMAGM